MSVDELPSLAEENAQLRRRLSAAQRPNRQRIVGILALIVVVALFGIVIILGLNVNAGNQHLILSNQAQSKTRGLKILSYDRGVHHILIDHSGQISHLEKQVSELQHELQHEVQSLKSSGG